MYDPHTMYFGTLEMKGVVDITYCISYYAHREGVVCKYRADAKQIQDDLGVRETLAVVLMY